MKGNRPSAAGESSTCRRRRNRSPSPSRQGTDSHGCTLKDMQSLMHTLTHILFILIPPYNLASVFISPLPSLWPSYSIPFLSLIHLLLPTFACYVYPCSKSECHFVYISVCLCGIYTPVFISLFSSLYLPTHMFIYFSPPLPLYNFKKHFNSTTSCVGS